MVDEDTGSRWMANYRQRGLDGLKNDPHWGGKHGQRWQRGRALYIKRTIEDQLRFELETREILKEFARPRQRCVPLAGDQTRVYLEGTVGTRWNPRGKQPRFPDRSGTKYAENIYRAEHLGTGAEVAPFSIDFQDAGASVVWFELVKATCPRGTLLIWLDSAPHLTDEEVTDYVEQQPSGNRRVLSEGSATYREFPRALRLLLGERTNSSVATSGLIRISGILVCRSSSGCTRAGAIDGVGMIQVVASAR